MLYDISVKRVNKQVNHDKIVSHETNAKCCANGKTGRKRGYKMKKKNI